MRDETRPLMESTGKHMPRAPWANAIPSSRNSARRLPQAVAHRGYKAAWPENTMGAFKGAVAVGAHGLETDTHLSADGVVVLSHDPSLKRCFGVDKKVAECDWEYLSTLRTPRAPHEGLPRLKDLLEWLAEPGLEEVWVLLDIKVDDAAGELIGAIARTIVEVPGPVPWEQRLVLGCWSATFIKAAREVLPNYAACHISFSPLYSWHFLPVANLGFNLRQQSLLGPIGRLFMREIRKLDRQLFVWTVNEERWMEWCIQKNVSAAAASAASRGKMEATETIGGAWIDAVITDDPKLYLEVCERYEDELDGKRAKKKTGLIKTARDGVLIALQLAVFQVLVGLFFMARRFQGKFDLFKDRRAMERL